MLQGMNGLWICRKSLIQPHSRGKEAPEAYDYLSVADSSNYDELQTTVLTDYDLRPETCHQKYRIVAGTSYKRIQNMVSI